MDRIHPSDLVIFSYLVWERLQVAVYLFEQAIIPINKVLDGIQVIVRIEYLSHQVPIGDPFEFHEACLVKLRGKARRVRLIYRLL